MALDRSHLTKEERDELRRSLSARRNRLAAMANYPGSDRVVNDARWRLFVVESLLHELGDR